MSKRVIQKALQLSRRSGFDDGGVPPEDQAVDLAKNTALTPRRLAEKWTPPEETDPRLEKFLKEYPGKAAELPGHVAESVKETAMYPGQVYRGEKQLYEMNTETGEPQLKKEPIEQAFNITGLGVTGSFPFAAQVAKQAAQEGSMPMFMFAGPRSARADLSALEQAKKMSAEGHAMEDIRQATGWSAPYSYRDQPQWMYEFSDKPSTFSAAKPIEQMTNDYAHFPPSVFDMSMIKDMEWKAPLNKVFNHPELYESYPELKDIVIKKMSQEESARRPNVAGSYDPLANEIYLAPQYASRPELARQIILHEVQHAIQDIEGLAPGYSVAAGKDWIENNRKVFNVLKADNQKIEQEAITAAKQKIEDAYADPKVRDSIFQLLEQDKYKNLKAEEALFLHYLEQNPQYLKNTAEINNKFKYIGFKPHEAYEHTLGEVLARATENRANLTPEQRKLINPFVTDQHGMDVSPKMIITDYKDGGKVDEYPLRHHHDWEEAHDYEKTGGVLNFEEPEDYLHRVKPLNMDHEDKELIHHFEKQMEHGEKLDPVAIYPDGHPNGRHRAHAAEKLGIKKIPVVTWPKKKGGGTVVDRALMILFKKV